LKIGKYSPGTHIPIVAEEEMFKDAPDYGLLLSWNFADEIIRKLRARGFKGGFIHPIPQFHVINEVVSFSDERGVIVDVLTDESVEHVNYITMAKGSVRGNHYHKQSIHYNYVLHGRIRFIRKMPYGPVREQCAGEGDLIFTGMNERHALQALANSEIMVFTRGPRGGRNYESDTFHLPEGERFT
jgi:quercetin dioxygenase-like cupin family protein